jgi:long-chain acyl-CoA synthetase
VIAFRGTGAEAASAIEQANTRLAEFQRVRRWVLWPEPDLPRTSTGKVRRKAVAEWLNNIQSAAATAQTDTAGAPGTGTFAASKDWLLALIAQITGEAPAGVGDELRLSEDLHLDSLGRVQLAAAIEERLGMAPANGMLEGAQTLGQLRQLLGGTTAEEAPAQAEEKLAQPELAQEHATAGESAKKREATPVREQAQPAIAPAAKYLYPHWPWWPPMRWLRSAFGESVIRPLTWLLAKPAVAGTVPASAEMEEPMLIVANHVSAFDAALLLYALPGRMRRRIAIAMSGEMLEDFRHFRIPDPGPRYGRFNLFGPISYLLVTAIFNVFPLPRLRDFQSSFAHTGEALDRGFNVLVFPEGARSQEGKIAKFRPGIGLLTKQSGVAVLPMALHGLGELKTKPLAWFRSGKIEVRFGTPIRFSPLEPEAVITARLQAEVEKLLND